MKRILTNGDPCGAISERHQVVDILEVPALEKVELADEFVKLYEKGLSLREIAHRMKSSKTSVRKKLIEAGISFRQSLPSPTDKIKGKRGKQNVRPFYGFCYFEGQIVKDPREYPNLLFIYGKWESGLNANALATLLNAKKIPSRTNKKWSWNAIQNFYDRFKTKKIVKIGGQLELK